MAPKTVTLKTFLLTLLLTVVIEILAGLVLVRTRISLLPVIGLARLAQAAAILWLVARFDQGLAGIGLEKKNWGAGLKNGLIWSAGFGLAAALGFGLLYLFGYNALLWIRTPLPIEIYQRYLYFLVGGLVAFIALAMILPLFSMVNSLL